MTATYDFPVGDTAASPTPSYLTQADFLDMFDRLLPFAYLEAMKQKLGDGYELFQAAAKVGERISLAVGRLDADLGFLTARGGVKSTGTVEFFRAVTTAGAGTVLKGTVVSATLNGRDFVTTADAVFAGGDTVKSVAIEAVAPGYGWNVPGPGTTAGGEAYPGAIDAIKLPLEDPPYWDPSIQVRQVGATTGGRAASLDQLGADRGITRKTGEGDSAYLARCRSLPDTLSPDAIARALTNLLLPLGIAYSTIETWELTYQTCWDAPATAPAPFDTTTFVYDDPRSPIPFAGRWLDEEEQAATFYVVLPNLDCFSDVGMSWDNTAVTVADQKSIHGRFATCAYDLPFSSDPTLVLLGCYDGGDIPKQALYAQVDDLMQHLKAAGVTAVIEKEGN